MITTGSRIGKIIGEVVIRNCACIAETSPRANDTPEIDDVFIAQDRNHVRVAFSEIIEATYDVG